MYRAIRVLAGVVVQLGLAGTASAQTSPYLPLDDPRLPLLEHLIARGDVSDPSPMIRPFRLADAVRVLATADTAPDSPSGELIRELRATFTEDTTVTRWQVEVRGGGEGYTQKRRDPLHLGGAGTANPYVDVALRGVLGPALGVARASLEPSLIGDPDWPNRAQEHLTGRLIEGYVGAQFKFGSLTFGQLQRNWGPVGLPGIPLSDVSYERQGLALDLGTGAVKLTALASDLRRQRDSIGQTVNRYIFVHRLEARLSRRFRLALWESTVIQGVGRTLETPFANPLSPSVLANSFGIADTGSNVMIGLDATWRVGRRVTLQTQAALDDFWFNERHQKQDRWAFTLAAYGPLGPRFAWRAWYTQASSLAFRTGRPEENFTDQYVGIGRNWSDQDQLSGLLTLPVAQTFLVTPELTFQRQGEGRINDPYPPLDANGNQATPMFLIGTVEYTYRAALGVSGTRGPLSVVGNLGFHHVRNDQHQAGVTANRVVARVRVLLAWRRGGSLPLTRGRAPERRSPPCRSASTSVLQQRIERT